MGKLYLTVFDVRQHWMSYTAAIRGEWLRLAAPLGGVAHGHCAQHSTAEIAEIYAVVNPATHDGTVLELGPIPVPNHARVT